MLYLFALAAAPTPQGEQVTMLTPGSGDAVGDTSGDTMTELDFELAVKTEQLNELDSHAHGGQSCPKNTPVGVLYNHVSKTGGTSMKQVLQEAMCGGKWGESCRVQMKSHYVKRKNDDGGKVADNGALFIEDDVADMKVRQEDADNFFIIGLIRRPCDFALSRWATLPASSRFHGTKPPYDTPEDVAAFQGWVAAMYDPNRKDPNYASMSVAIEEHVPDTSLVHCWARTHSMVHDVKHCLKRAKRCGVNVTLTGFKKLKGDVFGEDGNSSMHSEHMSCNNLK